MPMVVTFPNSPYELHQPFLPAGDQPEAIDQLAEGLSDGLAYQTLLGVTGSGKTYTMANVIARTGRPALVIAPNKTLAAQLYSEFREFFPENAVEYFVSYYDYQDMRLLLRERDPIPQRDLLARLAGMQYTRNDIDFRRGTFRVRGDTIDVFPAEHGEQALRISLFDEVVESLTLFDPLTGELLHRIPRFTLYAKSHYVP